MHSLRLRTFLQPSRQDSLGRLVLGDLIVAIDGKPIRNLDDLFRSLDAHQIGDTLTLTVTRIERRTDVQINLQAMP